MYEYSMDVSRRILSDSLTVVLSVLQSRRKSHRENVCNCIHLLLDFTVFTNIQVQNSLVNGGDIYFRSAKRCCRCILGLTRSAILGQSKEY